MGDLRLQVKLLWTGKHLKTRLSLQTDSKSATIGLRDSDIAVINRHNVGLVAIEAHLVSSWSKKDGQDYIHLGPSKTRVIMLAVSHEQKSMWWDESIL